MADETEARIENWLVCIYTRITERGWRLEYTNDRWSLLPSEQFIKRFGLVDDFRLGTYASLREAEAAFDAATSVLWLRVLREPTGVSDG